MSTESTRRDFLRTSAAGLAADAVAEALPAWGSLRSANSDADEIAVWVTDEKRRFERAPGLAWRQTPSQRRSAPDGSNDGGVDLGE